MKPQSYLQLLVLGLAFATASLAQVQSVTVSKSYGYVQTGPGAVVLDPEPNNYSFNADVNGANIGGITPPRVAGPFNVAAITPVFHNGGVLVYSAGDRGWRYGRNGDDAGLSSQSLLDQQYPNGTYTFTVNGGSIPLTLAGDAYPNAPVITLTGGEWRGSTYYIDPSQPLTLTTNAFSAYGSHADDLICVGLIDPTALTFATVAPFGCNWSRTLARQFRSQVPGTNFLSTTIPAGTLVAGREYAAAAFFQAIVSQSPNGATPGSTNAAYYGTRTLLSIKAESAVFPMTVTTTVTPTTYSATANIQPRPADVGSNASVYTFAVAPATITLPPLLKAGEALLPPLGMARTTDGRKADVACVLAQLTATGQLRQVAVSALQAYVTGVLTGQVQAIQVINGVATASIGGASFYVGYGSTAQSMFGSGTNRNVANVPGALECRPGPPQAGWWWNTAEGGRGYSIEAQGNHIFYAAFLYDETGRANWYVATGTTSVDGSLFVGDLLRVANGQTLGGAYRAPGAAQSVGAFTLAFSDAQHGTMVWPGGTVAIERFDIVPNGVRASKRATEPETGWWWNPQESGRGFFIEWQDGTADLAGYMYDDAGNAVWYLTVVDTPNPLALSGSWWQFANGQTLTSAYRPATRVNDNVAPVTITFTSASTATMALPNGRTTNLQRHRF